MRGLLSKSQDSPALHSQRPTVYSCLVADEEQDNYDRVFGWLGVDRQGTPYHLHPLNLVWSIDGVDHDLNVYRKAADRLAADLNYWAAIIRDVNWRYTLVGCVCLLVTQRTEHFDDLCFRYEAGSMVVPQLAVTLGLLNPERAVPFFERVLSTPNLRKHPTKAVAADMALEKLRLRRHREVDAEDWSKLELDDAKTSERVLEQQWAFWSARCGRRS